MWKGYITYSESKPPVSEGDKQWNLEKSGDSFQFCKRFLSNRMSVRVIFALKHTGFGLLYLLSWHGDFVMRAWVFCFLYLWMWIVMFGLGGLLCCFFLCCLLFFLSGLMQFVIMIKKQNKKLLAEKENFQCQLKWFTVDKPISVVVTYSVFPEV